MANGYKHGTYGEVGKTQAQSAIQAGSVPVYIGTAPIHLVRGYADKGLVNKPVKLTDYKQAVQAVGNASDWSKFTLCEAVDVHFNNPLGNVAPVYVINVLDPAIHKATQATTQTLTFANKRAEFTSDSIILDTFAIADKAESVDYSLDYDYTTGKVIVTDLTGETKTASATFDTVDTSAINAASIVGSVTASGEYSGIAALELLYNNENQVATYLAAPGWSHLPEVYNALVTATQKMNGHWMGYVYADIPIAEATTIEAAIAWRQTNGYTSEYHIPCWPKGITNAGKVYHLSTLSVWCQMKTDAEHDGIPAETASNKAVPVVKQYFGEGVKNAGFDKQRGNALNEKGIRTVVPSNGKMVLWGGHTGAYTYGATSDAALIFDTNILMRNHLINRFQRVHGDKIDGIFNLQMKDEILTQEQDYLDALVARGFLIGEPTISFMPSENSTSDMVNGDFTFSCTETNAPQFKSATISVSYTDAGFSVFTVSNE
jgi:hypothetical protein